MAQAGARALEFDSGERLQPAGAEPAARTESEDHTPAMARAARFRADAPP